MNRETIIEAMARALCLTATDTHTGWEHYKPEAVEVLAAIEAAGVGLVPDQPTEHMARQMVTLRSIQDNQGWKDTVDIYRTGVAASPYAPPGG